MTRLTGWGEFVARYTAWATPKWWQDFARNVETEADADGDWEAMIEERVAGLTEFLMLRRAHGEPKNWQPRVPVEDTP